MSAFEKKIIQTPAFAGAHVGWTQTSAMEMALMPFRTAYYLVAYTVIFAVLSAVLVLIPKDGR